MPDASPPNASVEPIVANLSVPPIAILDIILKRTLDLQRIGVEQQCALCALSLGIIILRPFRIQLVIAALRIRIRVIAAARKRRPVQAHHITQLLLGRRRLLGNGSKHKRHLRAVANPTVERAAVLIIAIRRRMIEMVPKRTARIMKFAHRRRHIPRAAAENGVRLKGLGHIATVPETRRDAVLSTHQRALLWSEQIVQLDRDLEALRGNRIPKDVTLILIRTRNEWNVERIARHKRIYGLFLNQSLRIHRWCPRHKIGPEQIRIANG